MIVTLCFVLYKNSVLMINRNKKPFMGLWNVLGGHLNENETIKECAIREIHEESGVRVNDATLISTCTWNYDDDVTYVYVSKLPNDFCVDKYPLKIDEGIVDFKDIDWILDLNNYGIVEDLRVFINDIKNNTFSDYHLIYDNSKLIEARKK